MAKRSVVVHVVPYMRWHREGRQTFQQARLHLVSLVDKLTETLATDAEQTGFLLDGQAVLLEDYVTLRPDRQALLAELVGTERLFIGPWYVTTDAFLASPEALVRNLLQGAQMVAQFGPRLDIAYMPDAAGHVGQTPQILHGFGIEAAVVERGLGEVATELWWEGPDGSRVLLLYLRDGHSDGLALPNDTAQLATELASASASLGDYTAANALLLMYGNGQQTPRPGLGTSLASASRRLQGLRAVPGNLPGYVNDVLAGERDYPTVSGELRSPARFPVMQGTLSGRMWIKQQNHMVQTLLERWAEPFSAWATIVAANQADDSNLGQPAPLRSQQQLLGYAWRLLLQNHTHDSIRGAIIDLVAHEVALRFEQAAQLTEKLVESNLSYLVAQIDTRGAARRKVVTPLVVFNAASHAQSAPVEVELALEPGQEAFEVVDAEGRKLQCELLAESQPGEAAEKVVIRFCAQGVPAFGYRTYGLRKAKAGKTTWLDEDTELTIENEWLSVSLDRLEGTLTVFDKRTGRSFAGLNHFRDGGDRGDAYNHCPPTRDTLIAFPTNTPLPAQRIVGPVTQTLEILQIYRLPQSLAPDGDARQVFAAQFVPVSIHTSLRLVRGVPRVDVEVNISNNARDHRLRVHFPTGIMTHEALFDGHYEVVRRPLALPDATAASGWAEQPVPEQPQRAFVTVLGSDTGLTIANRGLPEVAVLADPEHGTEIALTLLRGVGWLNREGLPVREGDFGPSVESPGAQCLGDHTFHYSIIPHEADPLPAWREAWAFQTPLRAQAAEVHQGPLPPVGSLVSVDNPLFVLSAVKITEDGSGLVVRGFSISESVEHVSLSLAAPVRHAQLARLDETPSGVSLTATRDGSYEFEAGPGQIVTLRLTMA